MSDSWLGHGDVDARAAGAHERDLSTRDRLHGPLADLVTDMNERRSSITELHGRETASVRRDHCSEHDWLHRLGDWFVILRILARHPIWCLGRRTIRRKEIVLDCGL